MSDVNDVQVGGTHYKTKSIQPWDAIICWGLGFLDGNVVKYVARFRSKGGLEDLKKARHYLDKLIEIEQAKETDRQPVGLSGLTAPQKAKWEITK